MTVRPSRIRRVLSRSAHTHTHMKHIYTHTYARSGEELSYWFSDYIRVVMSILHIRQPSSYKAAPSGNQATHFPSNRSQLRTATQYTHSLSLALPRTYIVHYSALVVVIRHSNKGVGWRKLVGTRWIIHQLPPSRKRR